MKQQNYIVVYTERDFNAPKEAYTGRSVQVWRPGQSTYIITSSPDMVVSLELITTSVEEAQAKCIELGSPLSDEMLVAFAESMPLVAPVAAKIKLTRAQLDTLSTIARRSGGCEWSRYDPVLLRLKSRGMVTLTAAGLGRECWVSVTEAGKAYLRERADLIGPLGGG